MSDRIVHYLPLPQQVGLLRTACGVDLNDPALADHDVATDREGVTCKVCLVTISDPASIQQVRDQGLPQLVDVEMDDGGTLAIKFDHWIAWVLGQAFREGLDDAGAANSLEYTFPEAEGSEDRVTVVVTATRPGSKGPTERALQAEALAQEYLRRLARARVRLDHGDAEGARGECQMEWVEQPWGFWAAFQALRAEAESEFYPEAGTDRPERVELPPVDPDDLLHAKASDLGHRFSRTPPGDDDLCLNCGCSYSSGSMLVDCAKVRRQRGGSV